MTDLKAPFPWFGGKSRCASEVWAALGDVANYVEPFAGSLAVLLARPHDPGIETVNDIDHYIVNFWRALQHAPDEVAHYANNPINEADLTARHIWLVNEGKDRIARLNGDPDYYDAKVAGWWVWGICCWIGGGWCAGTGPWYSDGGRLVHMGSAGQGVNRQRVHLGDSGKGVNRKRVSVSRGRGVSRRRVSVDGGYGVNRKRVHVGRGQDVNRQLARVSNGRGVETGEAEIAAYLQSLAERLRYVRVCCGDWKRVVTRGALAHGSTVGVFLDPPYDVSLRDSNCYNTDSEHGNVSTEVREWCIENQDNPRYRIVLAGYEGEHEMPGWSVVEWSANRSCGRANGDTANSENRHKERLWLSPNCKHSAQLELF